MSIRKEDIELEKIIIIGIILLSQLLLFVVALILNKIKSRKLNSINVIGLELIILPYVAGIIRTSSFSRNIFLLCLALTIIGIVLLHVKGRIVFNNKQIG
jgi:hypothetical protein